MKRIVESNAKLNLDTLAAAMKKNKETGVLKDGVEKLLLGEDDSSTCTSESSDCEY